MAIVWLLLPWLAVSVAAGDGYTCALTRAGTVKCWGVNSIAQLGDGTTEERHRPVDVVGLSGVTQISAGTQHACANVRGQLFCWGGDFWGGHHTRPRAFSGYGRVSSLSVGADYTCVVGPNQKVRCGGEGEDGILTAEMELVFPPEKSGPVKGLDGPVRQIAAGAFHACALGADKLVRCWGESGWGKFAPGSEKSIPVPRLIEKFDSAEQLALGANSTCALRRGEVFCWGDNLNGQLGDGTRQDRDHPAPVKGLPPIVSIAAGSSTHCAVARDGSAWCWGSNMSGNLGSPGDDAREPRRVTGLSGVKSISCGDRHCCSVDAKGRLKCWGSNQFGQLGVGRKIEESPTPLDVN